MNNKKNICRKSSYFVAFIAAVLIIVGGIGAVALLAINDVIGEEGAEILIRILLTVAITIGGHLEINKEKGNRWLPLVVSGSILIVLMAGGLCMDGSFTNVGGNVVAIASGCGISWAICRKRSAGRRKKKYAYR